MKMPCWKYKSVSIDDVKHCDKFQISASGMYRGGRFSMCSMSLQLMSHIFRQTFAS